MTKIERVFPAFGIIFAVVYAIVLYNDVPLVSYHPRLNLWAWGHAATINGPVMYWYGLVLTAFVISAPLAAVLLLVPENATQRLWNGLTWLVPLGAMVSFVWLLYPYYTK
jgi:hypothetical protein